MKQEMAIITPVFFMASVVTWQTFLRRFIQVTAFLTSQFLCRLDAVSISRSLQKDSSFSIAQITGYLHTCKKEKERT